MGAYNFDAGRVGLLSHGMVTGQTPEGECHPKVAKQQQQRRQRSRRREEENGTIRSDAPERDVARRSNGIHDESVPAGARSLGSGCRIQSEAWAGWNVRCKFVQR